MSDPFDLHEEGEHGGDEEGWLVSYADMMTLLFGFFAMLFSYASFDDDSLIKVRKELARFFGGMYANQVVPKADKGEKGKAGTKEQGEAVGRQGGLDERKTEGGAVGQDGLKSGDSEKQGKEGEQLFGSNVASAANNLMKDWDLKATEDGIEVAFVTTVHFLSGGSEIAPEAKEPLQALTEVIRGIIQSSETKPQIRIEGHTDDTPLSGHGAFKSNWELSAARAGAVAKVFEDAGFPQDTLSASGYGSGRPIYPNREKDGKAIPENQDRNRRVIIKVVVPKGPAQKKAD